MNLISALLRIVIIDLALSGDNAVIIGMAAHRLHPQERKKAILIGGAAAIGLRVALTAIAALLLQLPGLRLVGGLLLLWIGFKLLAEEEESHKGVKAPASMRDAVMTILVADFIMSTDNVLAVAAASSGNIPLLMFGLLFSMAILMFMGNLVANMVSRFWWLAYLGCGVIAWTGIAIVMDDPIVARRLPELGWGIEFGIKTVVTVLTLWLAHWFHRARRTD